MSLDIWRLLVTVVVAALAGGGITGLALLPQRRKMLTAQAQDASATADARIMGAAATLVEQAGTQVPTLMERITRLEGDRDRLGRDLDQLRTEQDNERRELDEWRAWGDRQQRWSAQAVEAIRAMGGSVADPPPPPRYVVPLTVS